MEPEQRWGEVVLDSRLGWEFVVLKLGQRARKWEGKKGEAEWKEVTEKMKEEVIERPITEKGACEKMKEKVAVMEKAMK